MEASSILRAVQSFAPVFGHHPTAVWDAAKEGAQKAADFLPENFAPVKALVRQHPVLATCAALALGGLLSARASAALAKA